MHGMLMGFLPDTGKVRFLIRAFPLIRQEKSSTRPQSMNLARRSRLHTQFGTILHIGMKVLTSILYRRSSYESLQEISYLTLLSIRFAVCFFSSASFFCSA